MPFTRELVSRGAFSSISRGYGVGGHGLKSHDDFEWTIAHILTSLQVIRKLSNIELFRPISLMSAHIIPQIHLEEAIDALSLPIHLGVEAC